MNPKLKLFHEHLKLEKEWAKDGLKEDEFDEWLEGFLKAVVDINDLFEEMFIEGETNAN